jgi:hypothetical protein
VVAHTSDDDSRFAQSVDKVLDFTRILVREHPAPVLQRIIGVDSERLSPLRRSSPGFGAASLSAGIADAALGLAATYDPRYLAQHNLIGVVGDETKAHAWYKHQPRQAAFWHEQMPTNLRPSPPIGATDSA